MAFERSGPAEAKHPLVTKEEARRFLPSGLDIEMDTYYPENGATCGEEHLRHVLGLMYPLLTQYRRVIVGQRAPTLVTLIGMFAIGDRDPDHLGPGHVHIVGPPGTGKSLLGMTPRKIVGADFKRIQGTNELLPTDITGQEMLFGGPDERRREFVPGPIFSQILLFDEMRRVSPRSLSGILESMSEGKVHIRGVKHIANPFVIATDNPDESAGVQKLPDALRDRFMFEAIEKPFTREDYRTILKRTRTFQKMRLAKIGSYEDIVKARLFFHETVHISDEMEDFMAGLAVTLNTIDQGCLLQKLRQRLQLPQNEAVIRPGTMILSGRSITHLEGAARAIAALRYRNYVTFADVQEILRPVIRHRTDLTPHALSTHENMREELRKKFGRTGRSAMAEFILQEIIDVVWNHVYAEKR
ncbi:MAG TPA: AAA family ATPase [Candidatus Paceibacterota bacterium]